MIPSELRGTIQQLLKDGGYYKGEVDKDFGPLTFDALHQLDLTLDQDQQLVPSLQSMSLVRATLFADRKDIERFKACKAGGNSDQTCFKFGDNGIGVWGDDTTVDKPYCALPADIWIAKWGSGKVARGKQIRVRSVETNKEIVCELRDTMPHLANITNHAGIDLNPFAFDILGLKNGEGKVTWAWV